MSFDNLTEVLDVIPGQALVLEMASLIDHAEDSVADTLVRCFATVLALSNSIIASAQHDGKTKAKAQRDKDDVINGFEQAGKGARVTAMEEHAGEMAKHSEQELQKMHGDSFKNMFEAYLSGKEEDPNQLAGLWQST